MTKDILERFHDKCKIDDQTGCWNWIGAKDTSGYGMISLDGKIYRAHRLSWVLHFDEISEGLFICHTCDNRGCVNPKHLFLGTQSDNIKDMWNKGRMSHRNAANGENHPSSKLTEKDVLEIRKLYTTGNYSERMLGKLFRVSRSTITAVIKNRTWKNT